MWLINGPFDCVRLGDEETLKTKLLKTNRTYGVGRHHDSPLHINNKKISRQNGQFIVGEHSTDDVSNDALVPTLSLRNNRATAMKITRGSNMLLVNPDSTHELESGDIVHFTGSISATVTWEPIVCFYTSSDFHSIIDIAACASLGIKLVTRHSPDITHHLVPSFTGPLTSVILYSLLNSASFVTPEWLAEFVRLGNDDEQGLEKTYKPPAKSGFRPLIDSGLAQLHPAMTAKAGWESNDHRKSLFEGMRFVFVVLGGGIGSRCKAMADVVSRGGATRQFIDLEKEAEEQAKGLLGAWGSVLKKRKVIAKEKMHSGLVLVAEDEALNASGVPKEVRDAWEAMVEAAKRVNMRVVHPSLIVESIIESDVSILDCVLEQHPNKPWDASVANPLPDHIPSTYPEEVSQLVPASAQSRQPSAEVSYPPASGPSRSITRRATSQTPVPEPALPSAPPSAPPAIAMELEEGAVATAPRKLLKRRAKTVKASVLVNELLGVDESTVSPEPSQPQPQSQSHQDQENPDQVPLPDFVSQTPARPSRLKRRAGTATVASQLFPDISATPEDGEEPPLKKFKALFEESGQGRTDNCDAVSDSQLYLVREEEEEISSQEQSQVGLKRKAAAANGNEDADMGGAEEPPAPKRRAIETINAVEPSPRFEPQSSTKPIQGVTKSTTTEKNSKSAKAKSGAVPGRPDTDPSFLRAIASTKRGKKTEDDFDREFNKLRIARPTINNAKGHYIDQAAEWGKEWDGLDNFAKDVGIRGNFMQIVEMDVWRDRQHTEQSRGHMRREEGLGARVDWDGREDFKKFKRKLNLQPRAAMQLFVSESQDYSTGSSYWNSKGDNKPRGFDDLSQSQDNGYSQQSLAQTQSKYRIKSQTGAKRKPAFQNNGSEDQEDEEVEEAIGKIVISKGKETGRQKKGRKPLFDPQSEEDVGATLHNGNEDIDLTLRSDNSQKEKSRRTKKQIVVPEESDSDDGMNFGGFAKRAKKLKP